MDVIRRIIFYLFLIGYVILCPLLILYSLGYIVYPFKEKLVHTGIIHLSSWPSGAQVFLEKSHYKEKTPATIRDLLPREYPIRLELKGYHPWIHKVQVEDGKAAAFDKILLIPDRWNTRTLAEGPFSDLTPLIGTEYVLLSRGEQLKDCVVYDWKKDTLQPFLEDGTSLGDFRVSDVFSREESQAVLIAGGPLWDRKYLYAQVIGQGVKVRDISKLITERPLTVEWDADNHDSLFALYEGHVDRLDTVSLAFYPKYIESIRGWGISRNQLFVIDQNNKVLVSPVGKKDFQPAFDNHELENIFAREKDFYEIKPVTGDTVIFLGSHGTVVYSHARPYFINEAIVGVKRDPGTGRLLVWTRKAIGIVDLTGDALADPPAGKVAKVRWVFDQGKDIRQCFGAYEGSHVVFRDQNTVFVLEPEPQGAAHLEPVVTSKENSSIVYVEARGVLYYLGAGDGRLYALDIISKKEKELR